MKAFFEEFDGSIVLGLFECVRANSFAFFRLFLVHLHGTTVSLLLALVWCLREEILVVTVFVCLPD